MNTPSTLLEPRLKTISLSAGTLAAAGAGLVLTQKEAQAGGAGVSGFIISTDPVAVPNYSILNIRLDLSNTFEPIIIGTGYTNGWNFSYGEGGLGFAGAPTSGGVYTYLFFVGSFGSSGIYSESQTFDLAVQSSGSFAFAGLRFSVPDTLFIGLRRTGGGDTINGWTQLDIASINHVQTAFNVANPSNIAIGQIPEPQSALLLAAGSAGLLAARRRRNKTA
ncbi:MAG: PEP-CTERM sorting domain-containing protein [Verrucomicrobiota bacterium]